MTRIIDLRSDANSMPTLEMRQALYEAELGDDILAMDPTVMRLQVMATELFGKEDMLLTVSGTMSNQIAAMALTQRGDEVILGEKTHMYDLEGAGLATLSQLQPRPIRVEQGRYDIGELEKAIRIATVQSPRTGLICIENTYNLNSGDVMPLDNLQAIREIADRYQLPVYLDGARLFNAATYLGVELADICQYVDAVQVCLTKGLGCPLGSLLLGNKPFIEQAKRIRQRLGGGMRQAGIVAAPGIIGLTKMRARIAEDHEHARFIAAQLDLIPGLATNIKNIQTNLVTVDIIDEKLDPDLLIDQLYQKNILVKKIAARTMRIALHHGISTQDVNHIVDQFQKLLAPAQTEGRNRF